MIKVIFNILNKKETITISILFLLILFSSFIELLGIGILYPFLSIMFDGDIVNNQYYKKYFFKYNLSRDLIINFSLIFIFFIYIIKNAIVFFTKWSIQAFARKIRVRMFKDVMTKYLYIPYEETLKTTTENTLKKINFAMEFSSTIIHFLTLTTETLVLLLLIIFLFVVNMKVTLVAILFFSILYFIIYLSSKKKLNYLGERSIIHYQKLSKHLFQSIGGIKEIKILGKQKFFLGKIFKIQILDSLFKFKTNIMLQLPTHVIEVASITFILSVIFYLIKLDFNNAQIISILGIYVISFSRLIPSSTRVLSALQNIKYSYPFMKMLEIELKNINNVYLSNKNQLLKKNKKRINFTNDIFLKNISFHYKGSKNYVLNKLNLRIKSGNLVGIYGKSGCGKSTLSEIIVGLLKPKTGGVYIDNVNINEDLKSWQNKIGVVTQKPYFLNDTIDNNITFGLNKNNLNNKKINQIIKETQLLEFINKLPKKMNTFIGERGISLSGGQLQRIAIARALYSGSELLIFDEASNALDTKNENSIIQLINRLKKK